MKLKWTVCKIALGTLFDLKPSHVVFTYITIDSLLQDRAWDFSLYVLGFTILCILLCSIKFNVTYTLLLFHGTYMALLMVILLVNHDISLWKFYIHYGMCTTAQVYWKNQVMEQGSIEQCRWKQCSKWKKDFSAREYKVLMVQSSTVYIMVLKYTCSDLYN